MKFRESGMPDEKMWDTFFNPKEILTKLGLPDCSLLVDVGCGYGTFLIPAAEHINGKVIGIDVDQEMIDFCNNKINGLGLNIDVWNRDIFVNGYGLDNETVDAIFLFNILHCEEASRLLHDTFNTLKKDGQLYVIHWNYDESTPRGPSMEIRPRPKQIIDWAVGAGFLLTKQIDVEEFHYGLVFKK